jgi:hypothetical protein
MTDLDYDDYSERMAAAEEEWQEDLDEHCNEDEVWQWYDMIGDSAAADARRDELEEEMRVELQDAADLREQERSDRPEL